MGWDGMDGEDWILAVVLTQNNNNNYKNREVEVEVVVEVLVSKWRL